MKKSIFLLFCALVALTMAGNNRDVSVPYNMYVEPGTNSCLVTWEDDDNSAWNLRYCLYTGDIDEPVLLHSLTGSAYTGSYADITLPAPWGGVNVRGGNNAIYIKNNYNNVAQGSITYTIPEGYTDATFKLRVTSSNSTYGTGNVTAYTPQTAEVGHNFSRNETFEWIVKASSGEKITMYTTDNNYSPDMSLIAVYLVENKNWIYANDLVKMEYNIEGLEMATDYEVQVQAIGDNGSVSDWCRPDVFTTLDEEPIIPVVHILGEVNGQAWSPYAGTKMEYYPESETYTTTIFVEEGNTFGFTLEIDDNEELGGWNYIEPYRFGVDCDSLFLLTDEYMGQSLPLSFENRADIKIMSTGEYEVTVSLERNYIIIGKISEPPHGYKKGDVNHDGSVNIVDVTDLIDYLLDSSIPICTICGDVNSDDAVNIVDVTDLIDMIMLGE